MFLTFVVPTIVTKEIRMRLNDVVVTAGGHLIDCATVHELKEAVRELRSRSPGSVLANLSEERIGDIEILREELGLEPCAG